MEFIFAANRGNEAHAGYQQRSANQAKAKPLRQGRIGKQRQSERHAE